MATLQLAHLDARLVFLALQYHLARPGSELDPETKQPAAQGLAGVARTLEPQLDRAVASIELNERQQERLGEAIAGTINELKAYALLSAGGRSAAPAFEATLKRLFPEVAEEPEEATQLAGHLLGLRRRLAQATMAAGAMNDAPAAARRPRWQFWRRDGG
jgi:hypothetical protein